jgi:REP element-mobilizing transposase RayT
VDDFDRKLFLRMLGDVVEDTGWRGHAYCLMANHYHLLIETPEPNLSAGMHRLNLRYARRFNRRYGFEGHVFDRRFYSRLVRADWDLLEVLRYVVLNPVRVGLCGHPADWPWSSYRATVGQMSRPDFLTTDRILSFFGPDAAAAREGYRRFIAEGLIHRAA